MTKKNEPRLQPIVSDAIESAGYLADSRVLTIRYRSGAVYEYYDVDPRLFTRLKRAQPHPWSVVGIEVKSHRFTQIA
jgi:KTSC domain-containing protein